MAETTVLTMSTAAAPTFISVFMAFSPPSRGDLAAVVCPNFGEFPSYPLRAVLLGRAVNSELFTVGKQCLDDVPDCFVDKRWCAVDVNSDSSDKTAAKGSRVPRKRRAEAADVEQIIGAAAAKRAKRDEKKKEPPDKKKARLDTQSDAL